MGNRWKVHFTFSAMGTLVMDLIDRHNNGELFRSILGTDAIEDFINQLMEESILEHFDESHLRQSGITNG